jgi:Thermolysin metallopeptidase, catalytic domain/Fungalysin/Thermolysin Propeptide Motif
MPSKAKFRPLGLVAAALMLGAVPSPGVMAGRLHPFRPSGASAFLVRENLGVVSLSPSTSTSLTASIGSDPHQVQVAAASTLKGILEEHYGFSGEEILVPVDQPIGVDAAEETGGTVHIRYKQLVDGLPLEGASIAIHFRSKTGTVYAVNGELHTQASIDAATNDTATATTTTDAADAATGTAALPTCQAALDAALVEFALRDPAIVETGTWQGDCQPAAVQGWDGKPYLAYKRRYRYQPSPSPLLPSLLSVPEQLDWIYAERSAGRLVAVHPTIFSERTMDTRDCRSQYPVYPFQCFPVTTSPNKIDTGDPHVNNVHNFTVDVYDMYARMFGYASMDGRDVEILSLAHYDTNFSNALYNFDEGYLAYGDGDGVHYKHFGQMDVSKFDRP